MFVTNTRHQLRTTEFTRVTDNLADPFDYETIARQFIEEVEEKIGARNEGLFVLRIEPLSSDQTEREEIDYLLTVAITPTDARRLDGTCLEMTNTI